ncbi:hypothetical protein [Bacillus solitudinis]|uniref:hypothetical protein n=1 Tax=Bacillus solitudinis TaxID=2014074 RepID=UPI000C24A81E|nr:hypothetical protein [Bacillus solitudinis]
MSQEQMHDRVILEQIEESWEEVKDTPEIEMSPKAIDWLIERAKKAERYEEVLRQIATPGTGRGYWEAKQALEGKE